MHPWKYLKSTDTMDRITRQELADNFDEILDRIGKEDIGFVILNEKGEDGQVICPAHWMNFVFDKDFGCFMIAGIRYAVERQTFMPNIIVGFIRRYLNVLDTQTLKSAIEEIDFFIDADKADDAKLWHDLRDELYIRLQYMLEKDHLEERRQQLEIERKYCGKNEQDI